MLWYDKPARISYR